MPEYLSPCVYVEEYESGAVPMEGVGTSTAGFIGLAEKGCVVGKPELVTSFSDYTRIFGGYLSETKFGDKRFLPYAVEHFFINGGSRAFVMRVCPSDAKAAATKSESVLKFTAKNPGEWGNRIKVTVSPVSRVKTQVYEVNGNNAVVRSTDGFNIGDVVEFADGNSSVFNKIIAIEEKTCSEKSRLSYDNLAIKSCYKARNAPGDKQPRYRKSFYNRYGFFAGSLSEDKHGGRTVL